MVALRNHGNCSNGSSNSSLPSSSQKPCFETWVTSGAEMTVPGICNFSDVSFNDRLRFTDLALVEPDSNCQMNHRRQPEFSLTIGMGNVNVNARLFPREEK